MDKREFDEDLFINCFRKAGANVTKVEPNQGNIYINGKEININEILSQNYPNKENQ